MERPQTEDLYRFSVFFNIKNMIKEKTKKVTKKVVRKFTGYELDIKVNDVEFSAKGKTIQEVLEKFIESKDYPFGAKTPMVVTLKKEGKESITRMMPNRARRLLLTMSKKPTALKIFSSTLERRFLA